MFFQKMASLLHHTVRNQGKTVARRRADRISQRIPIPQSRRLRQNLGIVVRVITVTNPKHQVFRLRRQGILHHFRAIKPRTVTNIFRVTVAKLSPRRPHFHPNQDASIPWGTGRHRHEMTQADEHDPAQPPTAPETPSIVHATHGPTLSYSRHFVCIPPNPGTKTVEGDQPLRTDPLRSQTQLLADTVLAAHSEPHFSCPAFTLTLGFPLRVALETNSLVLAADETNAEERATEEGHRRATVRNGHLVDGLGDGRRSDKAGTIGTEEDVLVT